MTNQQVTDPQYEIHVKGHLCQDWADWLEGLQIICLENGVMILTGGLADQAALLGVLNKLNRLNLAILSVNEIDRKGEVQPAGERQSKET